MACAPTERLPTSIFMRFDAVSSLIVSGKLCFLERRASSFCSDEGAELERDSFFSEPATPDDVSASSSAS